MFLLHLTSLNQGCLVKYSNCIHSAILTTFMDFWLFFTCFQLLAIYDVYKVYMSRWCRLHFLSLWNNKDIKSRSKLCTVFIKNTLTSLFVSNQNEKPHAEKRERKKHNVDLKFCLNDWLTMYTFAYGKVYWDAGGCFKYIIFVRFSKAHSILGLCLPSY